MRWKYVPRPTLFIREIEAAAAVGERSVIYSGNKESSFAPIVNAQIGPSPVVFNSPPFVPNLIY